MASDRRAYLSSLLIMPIAASLLLSACLRRMPPTAPAQPLAPPAAEAETETGRPGPHRETRKRYWARINAYKQAAARARALGARLGMKESASSQTSPQTGPNPFAWTFLGPQPIQAPPPTSPLSGSIRDIILDPINSSVIYVLTYLGKIWKTTDSGQFWTPLLDFGPVTVVDTLVADPILPNTLYAENGALYQSSDGGQTWNALPPVVQDSAQDCQTLAFAVSPAGMVWLALELCPSNSDLNGVYRSADRGETWNLVLVPGLSSSTPSVAAYLLAVGDAPYQFVDLRFNPATCFQKVATAEPLGRQSRSDPRKDHPV